LVILNKTIILPQINKTDIRSLTLYLFKKQKKMKKLLFALIAFTLMTTSCYKKDFKNLNTKIDALTSSVAGIATIQTTLGSIQTAIAGIAAQTAGIATLQTNLTALTAAVATINTNLNTLSTNVAANQVTVTGLLNDLKNQATANQTATTTLINNLSAALATAKSDLQTAISNSQTAVIAALTTQVNNLSAQLTAAQTALTSAIAASTAAVNAQAATNTTNIINAINTSATATQNAVQLQINTLQANLQAAITAGNTALAATIQGQITAAQNVITAAITAAQNAITADNATQTATLSALITGYYNALNAALALANAQLATLVNSNNLFLGDLTITNEAQLVFAESLGAKVRAITGNVYIDASTFTTGVGSQMERLKNVTNNTLVLPAPQVNPWIGSVVGNVTVVGSKSVDLSELKSVNGNVVLGNVGGAGHNASKLVLVNGNVTLEGSDSHNLSSLTTISGNYTVGSGATTYDPMDDALTSVGGNMWIRHYWGYSYPVLNTVGGLFTAVNLGVWTTIINYPALTSANSLNDGFSATHTLVYPNAATVNIGASAGLQSLVVNGATSVIFGEDQLTNGQLFIQAINAATVSVPNLTTVNGFVTIVAPSASSVNLAALVTLSTGALYVQTDNSPAGTVTLTNYTSNANNNPVQLEGPATQILPKFQGATSDHDVISGTITTLTLGDYRFGSTADLNSMSVLENLTVSGVLNNVNDGNLNEGPLKNLTLTANAYLADPSDVVHVNLQTMFNNLLTVSTAGKLKKLTCDGNNVLTTVTTAGIMDYLNLENNPLLTAVNMGHNFYNNAIGEGTHILVDNNDDLVSLTTSTSRLKYLEVRNNADLTTVNFASFIAGDNITAGFIQIHVHDNALGGTYTPSVFVTNTPPVMVQTGLSTLKAYALNIMGNPAYTFDLRLGYRAGGVGVENITATLDADRANHILAGGTGATTFVNRNGDADGGVGTQIGVARELNYLQ